MRLKKRIGHYVGAFWEYLLDYRFSRILIKYFVLLFVCLVLPVTALSMWYYKEIRKNMNEEILKRNEASLEQAYSNVNSVLLSTKNLAYSLSVNSNVKYLAYRTQVGNDTTGNLTSLVEMLSILWNANAYLDSSYLYFANSEEVVTNTGVSSYEEFKDKEVLELFSRDMPARTVLLSRIKRNHYPYLLTVLYPIRFEKDVNAGLVVINIDVEKLGDYIGSGSYRSKSYAPRLLIFNESMETLVYSDEYRLLQDDEELSELKKEVGEWTESFSAVLTLWDESYVVSGIESEEDGLRYLYLTTMQNFAEQNEATENRLWGVTAFLAFLCLVIAFLLAVWVYKPIRRTIRVLSDVSMLTEWDQKEHMDEIEAIQRSILTAKREKDDLNEQIRERIVSLHNAQICALQTQINPHFLFNTLEAIGNTAALLMNGDNQVTEMIYTLGKLMRISLSNENYLVPLEEELEHVELYVKLITFRFHGRVSLHQQIPKELGMERIVKLTLQPLIENAVQHGLIHKRTDGEIWLKGEKKEGDIFLYVIDNGAGMTPEELKKLSEHLKESAITGSSHIGMRNVDQRLKLVFGEEYGLSVSMAEEGGLRVTIHIRKI